jgi:3,4-dihydroxy 2-butanone 4-phosphate synthase/GTP cyclohydrolase II
VLQKGEILRDQPVLTRVHVDNFTRDLFQSLQKEDSTLLQSWAAIEEAGAGALVLLRGNNRPQISVELKALFGATEDGRGPEMDERDYGIGAQILRALGAHKIRLLSNRPERRVGLKAFELEIVEIVPVDLLNMQKTEAVGEADESRSGHEPLQ